MMDSLARRNLVMLAESQLPTVTDSDKRYCTALIAADRDLTKEDIVAIARIRAKAAGRVFIGSAT